MIALAIMVTLNLIFSVLNLALMIPLVKIASDVVEVMKDMPAGEPEKAEEPRRVVAVEEPGLLDLDMTQPNFTGLPVRLD
jgi:hypothetical protein